MKLNVFKSYKFKFLFFVILFMLITCFAFIFLAIRDTKNTSVNIFSERGKSVLEKTISKIDIEQYKRISKSLDKNDSYFSELKSLIKTIKEESSCKSIYLLKQVSGNNFVYIVDEKNQIGTKKKFENLTDEPLISINEKRVVYSGLKNQNNSGWIISVYSPILDKNKTVLGVIGVDFDAESLEAHLIDSRKGLLIIGAIVSLLGIILILILVLSFFKSFNSVVKAMNNLSSGTKNLSERLDIPKSAELGNLSNSCNELFGSFQNTMQTVSSAVGDVNSNSAKILDQTRQLLDLINNVSGNVNDVQSKATSQTNLINSLETNTHDLHDSIQILNTKIAEQSSTVSNSIKAIESIVESINGTDNQINNISNAYETIVQETKENEKKQNDMTEKIKFIAQQAENLSSANAVITGIASKTNLLAMNAAIEASHAGEAGKGFSVVASEIRALAENSSKQTQYITNLVNEIDDAVKQIVNASDDSEKAFSSLGHKIEDLSHSMISIKENMNTQNESATNITTMLGLLTEATSSISSASNTINEKTQNVVKGINTMKFSIKRINETSESAKNLLGEMSQFAHDTNDSSENNKKAVDNINELVDSYKF